VPNFEPKKLEEITLRIFVAAGATESNARELAEHLVDANLTGHDSHGVIRIPSYIEAIRKGELAASASPKITKETATTACVDGNKTFGQVTGNFAARVGIDKARRNQVAAISLCNHGHLGRLGAYPEMCARAGFASIMYCGGGGRYPSVVPFGGTERRLSTNPIAMACPSDMEGPILLDYATSVSAEGKLRVYRARGHKLPDTWVVDSEGKPSTDPNVFYDGGALMPLGGSVGHKGYAMAYMVELFGSILGGIAYAGEVGTPNSNGGFLIVFDPTAFLPAGELKARTRKMTSFVKSSPVAESNPYKKILYPGEKEMMMREERRAKGIPIEDATWEAIGKVMRDLGVKDR
jgi:uncharacterized oxidoreductase